MSMPIKSPYPPVPESDRKVAREVLFRTMNRLAAAAPKTPPSSATHSNRVPVSHILITCPITRKTVQTEYLDSPLELEKHWEEHAEVQCPHCGEAHHFVVRQAFVAGIFSDQGFGNRGVSDRVKELEPKAIDDAAAPKPAGKTKR